MYAAPDDDISNAPERSTSKTYDRTINSYTVALHASYLHAAAAQHRNAEQHTTRARTRLDLPQCRPGVFGAPRAMLDLTLNQLKFVAHSQCRMFTLTACWLRVVCVYLLPISAIAHTHIHTDLPLRRVVVAVAANFCLTFHGRSHCVEVNPTVDSVCAGCVCSRVCKYLFAVHRKEDVRNTYTLADQEIPQLLCTLHTHTHRHTESAASALTACVARSTFE